MQDAKLTWVDPTGPLTGLELSMRISGAPDFTVLTVVPKGVQNLAIPQLADGDYDFKIVALNGARRGLPVLTSGKAESGPGVATSFAVAFSDPA